MPLNSRAVLRPEEAQEKMTMSISMPANWRYEMARMAWFWRLVREPDCIEPARRSR